MAERVCPHCGGDITDELNASFEFGYERGYEKRAQADLSSEAERDDYKQRWEILGRVSRNMIERLERDLAAERAAHKLTMESLQAHDAGA